MTIKERLNDRLNEHRQEALTRVALSRAAALEDYLEHGAEFSEDFNHRLYSPRRTESPDDMREYHGTSIGAIFCPCGACQFLRATYDQTMNGWVILPLVHLVRRAARAPMLKTVAPEPVVRETPAFLDLEEKQGYFKRAPGGVVLVGPI